MQPEPELVSQPVQKEQVLVRSELEAQLEQEQVPELELQVQREQELV